MVGKDRDATEIKEIKEASLHDATAHAQVKKINNFVFERLKTIGMDMVVDFRKGNKPNPWYNQTTRGFFLEGEIPTCLWTPWGQYQFVGSMAWHGDLKDGLNDILRDLGAVRVSSTLDGPVYALHRINGESLPEPMGGSHVALAEERETASQAWEELEKGGATMRLSRKVKTKSVNITSDKATG
jgi:hypothetical protein